MPPLISSLFRPLNPKVKSTFVKGWPVLLAVVVFLGPTSLSVHRITSASSGNPGTTRSRASIPKPVPAAKSKATPIGKNAALTARLRQQSNDAILAITEMNIARKGHTATELADGQMLVVGGENSRGLVRKSEILDADSRGFSVTARLKTPRADHTATRLSDGTVLMAGGRGKKGLLSSTEFFDSSSSSFVKGRNMNRARSGHTATVLADGRILIAGGDADGTAEIFDPVRRKFALLEGRLSAPRSQHAAVLMKSGKVLIAGGLAVDGKHAKAGEVFDPESLIFQVTSSHMTGARLRPVLKVLPDGKVQVIGGDDERSMEMFNNEREYFTAYARLGREAESIPQVLKTQTRAALVHRSNPLELALRSESHSSFDMLFDRSDHALTDSPESGRAVVSGGMTGSGEYEASAFVVASSSATVTTDKTDYQPGDIVIITGTGWEPGETVDLKIERDNGEPDTFLSAVANADGSIQNSEFVIQDSDLGVTFLLTATGLTSERTAQTTFTDSNPQSISVGAPTSVTVAQGETAIYGTLTLMVGGNTNQCNVTFNVGSGFPAGATPVWGTNPIATTGSDVTTSFSVITTGTTPTGTFTFRVTGTNSAPPGGQCQGSGPSASNLLTLVVTAACAAPTITCPPNLTVQCDADVPAHATNLAEFGAQGGSASPSSPACGPVTITHVSDVSSGSCPKTIMRTYRATGASGHSADCTQTITVDDTMAPVATTAAGAGDATLECSDTAGINTALAFEPAFSDNCTASVTADLVSDQTTQDQTCANAYVRVRKWTASDGCGNTSLEYSQTITVVDTTAPVATTAAGAGDGTFECSDTDAINAALTFVPTFSDNCTASVTANLVSDQTTQDPNCPNGDVRVRKWTASDGCGNTSLEYSQTITVVDTTAPVATTAAGAGDGTFECSDTAGINDALAFEPAFSDNCTASVTADLVSDQTTQDQTCANAYMRVRKWTASDGCGNTSLEYTQTITVVDTTAPVATTAAGAGDATLECSHTAGINAALAFEPAFSDNCTASVTANLVYDQTTPDPNCPNAYVRVRKWTASDGCGNTSLKYTQTITVVDTTAPVATTAAGAGDATLECSHTAGINAALAFEPAFSDNCTASVPANLVYDQTTPDPNCPNAYVRVRKWTASDGCGNTSLKYSQTITVVDTTPPVIQCPEDIVTPGFGEPQTVHFTATATDNCGAALVACVPPSGSTFPVGVTTVTCTATDVCENINACTFDVTVPACVTTVIVEANFTKKGSNNAKKEPVEGAKVVMLPKASVQAHCNLLDATCVWSKLTQINAVPDPVFMTGPDGSVMVYSSVPDPNGWAIYIDMHGAMANGATINMGTTKIAVANSDCAPTKRFTAILVADSTGTSATSMTQRQQQITGSLLEIIYPGEVVWDGWEFLYPFIFTSDSDWEVDVCASVPQGYRIVGSPCEQLFVANETKVIFFEVNEVGSPEPRLRVRGRTRHNGKTTQLDFDVPGVRNKNRGKRK